MRKLLKAVTVTSLHQELAAGMTPCSAVYMKSKVFALWSAPLGPDRSRLVI
jgi:hypothetical protein